MVQFQFWRQCYGRPKILSILLENYGMDVNARCEIECKDSLSALTWAILRNNGTCIPVLLKHSADINKEGIVEGTHFENAGQLDQLCKAGEIDSVFCVINRDDTIKNLLKRETERQKGGEGTKSC